MKRIRDNLTFSNVVALLALFVAVGGGTAYAMEAIAPNSVGTEQLKSSAVIAAKIKDGSVNSAKLAPNSVTEAAIAKGAVATNKLPTGAVINSKIAAGAVNSASVADGSLTTSDLAAKPVVVNGGSGATTTLGEECTQYEYAEVTIDAPSAGTVTVNATSWMNTSHTAGNYDSFFLSIGESPTECNAVPRESSAYSIPASLPELSQYVTLPVLRTFSVAAGSHTYYLNGYQEAGPDVEQFYYAGLTATFIPN